MRRLLLGFGLLAATAFTGCRHKTVAVKVPVPPPATVPLDKTPDTSRQVAAVPMPPPILPRVEVPRQKVKKPRKKVVPATVVPPPVQVASGPTMPEESVIGSLTLGGDLQTAQPGKTADLLGSLDRRVATLPDELKQKQGENVRRVQYFLAQAHDALKTGDVAAADTLANKAKLLLDEILK